jgi:hypothetical protein
MALHVCVRGIGIRRSKDLRAEIGKCPNSTNERKQMSTKTIYKRIALVAVAALGAGVLSVAPANAGTIAVDEIDISSTSKTEVCSVDTDKEVAYAPLTSSGIQLQAITAAATDTGYLKIAGPALVSSVTPGTNGDVSAVSQTAVNIVDAGDSGTSFVVLKPTAVGTVTVSVSNTSASAVLDVLTIYIVASCANAVYSAAASFVTIVSNTEADNVANGWTSTKVDTADANIVAEAGTGTIAIRLKDAYGAALTSAAGVLVVTATGDVVVNAAARTTSNGTLAPASAGATNTAYVTGASAAEDVIVRVDQDSGAPTTSTVTMTYNGTVVGTKTFVFAGAPASVTVSDVTIGLRGSSNNFGYFRYTVKDANGNALAGDFAVADDVYNAAALSVVSAVTPRGSGGAGVTAAVTGKTPGLTGTLAENARYTCTALGGAAKLQIKVAVDANSTKFVTSAPFDVMCGGAIDTWSVSLDKATYAPGEIATLTVAAKDSKGLPVHTLETVQGLAYAFGGMTAVTAPTDGDKFSSAAGAKTYQFSVGTSEGSFVGTWKMTGATDTAAKTVQYKIAGPASTSNADVLKAIVSLIASINKQIAALQKALLRR